MKPKTMALMVIAIVCGLGASYMTSRLLAERSTEEVKKVLVLKAKKNVDSATSLVKVQELFDIHEFPEKDANDMRLVRADQMDGLRPKFLKRALRQNDLLKPEDLDDNFSSIPIPEGMRAKAISVNPKSAVAGFAAIPGSRVDVIQMVKGADTHINLLLENVLVLAADAIPVRPDGTIAITASNVTLALSPFDAMRVTLAENTGELSLMLRKPGDTKASDLTRVGLGQLLDSTRESKDRKTAKEWAADVAKAGAVKNPGVPDPLETKAEVAKKEELKPTPPVVKQEEPKKEEPKAPKYYKHVVLVVEGENQRTVTLLFDAARRPVTNPDELSKDDVDAAEYLVPREDAPLESAPAPKNVEKKPAENKSAPAKSAAPSNRVAPPTPPAPSVNPSFSTPPAPVAPKAKQKPVTPSV